MDHDRYSDAYLRDILCAAKTIAVVGVSAKTSRPSHGVFAFLLARGYRAIPVNPGLAGGTLLGQPVYATLADIPEPVDMVDVFRSLSAIAPTVDEVLRLRPLPAVIWTQLGLRDDATAARAEAVGVKMVMDRCPAIEYPRLFPHGVTR